MCYIGLTVQGHPHTNMGSPSARWEIHSPAGACKHGVSTETTLQCAQQPGDAKPTVTKSIKMSETDNRPQDVVGKKKKALLLSYRWRSMHYLAFTRRPFVTFEVTMEMERKFGLRTLHSKTLPPKPMHGSLNVL